MEREKAMVQVASRRGGSRRENACLRYAQEASQRLGVLGPVA